MMHAINAWIDNHPWILPVTLIPIGTAIVMILYTIIEKLIKRMYMNKNERINIKAAMNGYIVERSWRESGKSGSDGDVYSYRYMDEEFMFKTWDEVVEFVNTNKLDVPPAKI